MDQVMSNSSSESMSNMGAANQPETMPIDPHTIKRASVSKKGGTRKKNTRASVNNNSSVLKPANGKNKVSKKTAGRKTTSKTTSKAITTYFSPSSTTADDEFDQEYQASKEDEADGQPLEEGEELDDEAETDPKFFHSTEYRSKPNPVGMPEVWSFGRQPLCDALTHFKALQGGCYRSGGEAKGLLVSSVVGIRDKFSDEYIITTCGGGRTKTADGMVQVKDQEANNNYALCMKESMEIRQPVCVIAGQGNTISPVKLPYAFNVLGWFHITKVWMELRRGYKCWVVKLEKLDLSKPSWWSPQGKPFLPGSYDVKLSSQVCKHCKESSDCLYNVGWFCLNTQCKPGFFQHPNLVNDDTLDYSEEFLQSRTRYEGKPPEPLAEPLLTTEDINKDGHSGTESKYKKGMVCPKCHCCSRRLDWDFWRCENPACDFVHKVDLPIITATDAIGQTSIRATKKYIHLCDKSVEKAKATRVGSYTVYRYDLPGIEKGQGQVYHIKSNGPINNDIDGPNQIFEKIQTEKFGLKRNPARNAGKSMEVVTSHWTANHGAPYKYGVRQGTAASFADAPPTVLQAIKRLEWVAGEALKGSIETPDQKFLENSSPQFNEVLTVGYFEGSAMGYHDDGERELGPTVASISFGGAAAMSWRPKKSNDIKVFDKDGEEITRADGKPDVLRIVLRHGDIMIMNGAPIQKLYEHRVEALGKIRFAMTCRQVKIETVQDTDKKKSPAERAASTKALQASARKAATMPEGHEQYNYDGNVEPPQREADKDAMNMIRFMGKKIAAQAISGHMDVETMLAELNDTVLAQIGAKSL